MSGSNGDLDPWVSGRELLEERGQHIGADRRRGTENQATGRGRARVGQRLPAIPDRPRGALRVGEEGPARVGQAHPALCPGKKRLANLALERVKAGGERGLSDEHPLSGTTDVPAAAPPRETPNPGPPRTPALHRFSD